VRSLAPAVHRGVLIGLVVLAIGVSFLGGYVVGRGDRTTAPDLAGLQGQLGNDAQVLSRLRNADLRIGRTRSFICGDWMTRGIVVKQSPPAGASAAVGSAVDIWVALPRDSAIGLSWLPERPCPRIDVAAG
jgi:hypothetical protein